MAVLNYHDYVIVAAAKQESSGTRWCVAIDISSRDAGRSLSSLETHHEFETQAQAEDCGLNLARAWIDQRIQRLRYLRRERQVATDNDHAEMDVHENFQVELRTEVRKFAERIEQNLREDEKKNNRSWMKSSIEDLVHAVLDNTSSLLMTNYNEESQRPLLEATCLDLATLSLIIRCNSMRKVSRPPEATEQNEHSRDSQRPKSNVTANNKSHRQQGTKQRKLRDPSLVER